jgi:hypothetical protein
LRPDRVVDGAAGADDGASTLLDLTDDAVGKSLDGVFHYIAQEEAAIRTDPGARTTALLKQVFGGWPGHQML